MAARTLPVAFHAQSLVFDEECFVLFEGHGSEVGDWILHFHVIDFMLLSKTFKPWKGLNLYFFSIIAFIGLCKIPSYVMLFLFNKLCIFAPLVAPNGIAKFLITHGTHKIGKADDSMSDKHNNVKSISVHTTSHRGTVHIYLLQYVCVVMTFQKVPVCG